MKTYINELIELGMGNVIDMNIDKIITEDEIYQKSMHDADEVLVKLTCNISHGQKLLFEDYIACMMSANERGCVLAYLIGARNTIQFLSEIGALKTESEY